MPKKSGPTNRDMFGGARGHNTGAGKGDTPRTKFNDNWRANFNEIDWPKSDDGFKQRGGKRTKRYGPAEAEKLDKAPNIRIS
jgi:hypothetical protein